MHRVQQKPKLKSVKCKNWERKIKTVSKYAARRERILKAQREFCELLDKIVEKEEENLEKVRKCTRLIAFSIVAIISVVTVVSLIFGPNIG